MNAITGYDVTEQLHESVNSLVYRGIRASDGSPVILKMLKDAFPAPEQAARFQREYSITRTLNLPGIIKAYSLETFQHKYVMVLEDFGGQSLSRMHLAGAWELAGLLRLAIDLTETIGQMHQQHIIHKDINPSNIVYNAATQEVRLIDFGISTVLSRETPTFRNPDVLEGTLAYMAPEQTGRMNRAIDYRTDFYAFGATLYELLTGLLPFSTDDPLELVHAHIARQPVAPHAHVLTRQPQIDGDAPLIHALSAIILKLMAKNAEDRYQSAYGLKADLELALTMGMPGEHPSDTPVDLTFVPGCYDVSDQLVIPQKLYGREEQVTKLLTAFEDVCQGINTLMLVSGIAGIGKSALVQEVHKPITRQRGYFIAGKFDQFQRDIPYSALIDAFGGLMRQLLTENRSSLAAWQECLLAALGEHGQVIIDIIPELELIIGPQPPLLELGPAESQNRFNLIFQRFIQVFTRPEHPLVLFVDDMQWADGASLALLQQVFTRSGNTHDANAAFLVIGAYRDNEVDASHPLHLMVQDLVQSGVAVQEIHLFPLDNTEIEQFVQDTVHRDGEPTQLLAEVLKTKTNGNPFFMGEFLKSLYAMELLTFTYTHGEWQWDLGAIQGQQITDNVVELMQSRVQQLPPTTQHALKLAACIGNHFALKTLALVAEQQPVEMARTLEEALTDGLLIPSGNDYQLMTFDVPGLSDMMTVEYMFAHDRIQQAVYDALPEAERQSIHWHIGYLLLAQTLSPSQSRATVDALTNVQPAMLLDMDIVEEHIFELVPHLNEGQICSTHQAERDILATLNLIAGRKARASAAYGPCYTYLKTGIALLTHADETIEHAWDHLYHLTLDLHVEAAEAAYLCGDFEQSAHFVAIVLEQAHTLLDKVKAYEIQIVAAMAQNELVVAVQTALHVLQMLGVDLPEQPEPEDFMGGFQEVAAALAEKPVETLHELPAMTDPYQLAAMRILTSVMSAAYLTSPVLTALITFQEVLLSLRHGNAPMSAFAYGMYGFILCGVLGDIETGYTFGTLALRLAENPAARECKASVMHVVHAGVRHWKVPIRDTLPSFLQAYQTGLETGDVQYAASAAYMHFVSSFICGVNVQQLAQEKKAFGRSIAQLKQEAARMYHRLYEQVVSNLIHETESPWVLAGEAYDEATMLPVHEQMNDQTGLHLLYVHKLMVCYLFGAYEQAVEYAALAEHHIAGVTSSPQVPFFYFYDSLARLAVVGLHDAQSRTQHEEKIAANQEKMLQWSHLAPMNCAHKWHLIEGERARVQGNDGEAWSHYYKAMTLAQEQGYMHEEALAYELMARFYGEKGLPDVAQTYLHKAHYAYECWGAIAKVRWLEQHALYVERADASATHGKKDLRTTIQLQDTRVTTSSRHTRTTQTLDFASVMKASQALSGEIVLETLLEKLMHTMIENAGAERGVLILDQNGHWVIEAQTDIHSGETKVLQSIPLEYAHVPHTIINYVAHSRESVVLSHACREGQFTQAPYVLEHELRSVLCTPLMYHGTLTGMLYLENNQSEGAFTKDRLEVLTLLYGQIAISIENARLYATTQASERKYRALFEGSSDVIFISSPTGALLDINPAGLHLFGYAPDEVWEHVHVQDYYANPAEREHIAKLIQHDGLVRDYELTLRRRDGTMVECVLTASLHKTDEHAQPQFHGILRDITAQKQAERERLQLSAMQRELSIAHDIQQSLLPPSIPQWEGLDVVCYTRSAREVGGDLYAFYAMDAPNFPPYAGGRNKNEQDNAQHPNQTRYAIAVGDVSGKGVPAALLMAVSMASFHSFVGQGFAPGAFLTRMDKALVTYTRTTNQNCALVYVDIDVQHPRPEVAACGVRATAHIANAGCVTPIMKRADGNVTWVDVGGLPLGIEMACKMPYGEIAIELEQNDLIILTSDGVIEANNAAGDMFGFERLEQAVRAGPQIGAAAMLTYLRMTVEAFVGDTEPHDDITIVVIQV